MKLCRFLFFFILICSFSCPFSLLSQAKKPNILFIMSDDHSTQAIGAYGSRLASLNPTPNIDALAKGGIRFDKVFCNNSICTPSRASIISGQYSQANKVLTLDDTLSTDKQYLPIELKKGGYQTAIIGKWHLKTEPTAFDYYCVLPGQGQYFNPSFLVRGEKAWPDNIIKQNGKHSSDAIADLSLEWLKNGRDPNKPFLLMHHFKAPHDMFLFAPRYKNYLEDVKIPTPANLFSPLNGSQATQGFGSGLGLKNHAPWGLGKRLGISPDLDEKSYTEACYQEFLKRYLRCVKGVDDNILKLLDCLKEIGEFENTIIIYTSDQGSFLGEHDLMDKRWMFEESIRMPFIVYCPSKIKGGQTNDWLINNTDFAPTILALAGIEVPKYMQGKSFTQALNGEDKPENWRKATYYRYWMHMAHDLAVPAHFGIRSDRYKLIFFYGCGMKGEKQTPVAWEFYDLLEDPQEMVNQYANIKYRNIIESMKIELKNIRTELNETDEGYPAIQNIIEKNWSKY